MIFCRARHVCVACAVLFAAPGLALADSQRFDIPAEPLASALEAFAAQAHMQLFYLNSVIGNARGNAVRGQLDAREALDDLLRDTGLEAVYTSDTEVTIRRSSRPRDAALARHFRPNSASFSRAPSEYPRPEPFEEQKAP